MLTAQEIINGLQGIVDNYSIIAIIWHVLFYILIIALAAKWKPSNRLMSSLLSLPVLSAGILALVSGNPFNGSMFLILAILIIIYGLKTSTGTVGISKAPYFLTGMFMVAFGLLYPHFLGDSFIKYLYASPAGLIPCPTLSLLTGFILMFNGFGSKALNLVFIIYGLFYGIFGVLKLSVYVDLFLIFGSIALLLKYITSFKKV